MTIGELLKDFRLRHHLTQTEMSCGVVSTSFYAKVEKDIHKINVEDLLMILEGNQISLSTFFKRLAITRKENVSRQRDEITQTLMSAYFQGDRESISNLKFQIETSLEENEPDKKFLIALIQSVEASMLDDLSLLTTENKNILKNTLFNLAEWDEFKLSLYCNLIDIYDLESNIVMVSSILQKKITSYSHKQQRIIFTLLINMIAECIEGDLDHLALSYILQVDDILVRPDIFFEKVMLNFYKTTILYRASKDQNHLEKIYQLSQFIQENGMESYSLALKEFIEKQKKS